MVFKKKQHRKSSSSGGMLGGNGMIQVDAMLYGAVREKMSNALSPITSKIPLGDIADEVGMGLVNWFIAKKTSGLLSNVAKKGLIIENARLGEALISGSLFGGSSNGGTQLQSNNGYTYG